MPEMDAFFAQRGVRHRLTREWSRGGRRHWFTVDEQLTLEEVRELLKLVPVGAYVQCFDPSFDSPSDPGAWVDLQRYPELWTATFSNHGWSSWPVPIDFEDAVTLFWEGRDFDYGTFLGHGKESEHMAHSGLSAELPTTLDRDPNAKPRRHICERVAEIRRQIVESKP